MPDLKPAEALAQNGNGTNGHANGNGKFFKDNKRQRTGKKEGAPSKLNAKVTKRICKALENCCTIRNACALAGISEATFRVWKERAEIQQEPQYLAFLAAVRDATAKAEENLVKCVKKASKDDWRAAVTILERRHPDDWMKKEFTRTEHTGANGGPIQQKVEQVERPIDDTALENFARIIMKEREIKPHVNGNG